MIKEYSNVRKAVMKYQMRWMRWWWWLRLKMMIMSQRNNKWRMDYFD